MYAAEKGKSEIVNIFLREKYSKLLHLKDRKNKNALFYSIEAQAENTDVVLSLIDRGASSDVNLKCSNGITPLIKAIELKYSKIAKILCKNCANVNMPLNCGLILIISFI